jgi:hypothetical protein
MSGLEAPLKFPNLKSIKALTNVIQLNRKEPLLAVQASFICSNLF